MFGQDQRKEQGINEPLYSVYDHRSWHGKIGALTIPKGKSIHVQVHYSSVLAMATPHVEIINFAYIIAKYYIHL